MAKVDKLYLYALLVLIFAVIARGSLLEYTSLIDPTEARYAVVAQYMLTSGDWLTPMLPMPEGLIPYLGKPPLHFWLTAISYNLFGVDEWSARLPSLLATLLILAAIWQFSARVFSKNTAWVACLIYISAGVPFFLSGASVTDVTLTALVTTSVVFLYEFISKATAQSYLALLAAAFAALSFLTKGPIGLVLIWLPLLLWSAFRKDFSWAKKFPWFSTVLTFMAISLPWFVLSELKNPGFLKYFFWNENIARFLFKDYGDNYGSGHVHWYGTSWIMLLGVFFPWVIIFSLLLWRRFKIGSGFMQSMHPHLLFVFCWSFSTPIFFTFIKQLHGMYLLPALPPLCIATSHLILHDQKSTESFLALCSAKYRQLLLLTFGLCVIVTGCALQYDGMSLIMAAVILLFGIFILGKMGKDAHIVSTVTSYSLGLVCLYLVGIASMTPFIDYTRSSELVLEKIAARDECRLNGAVHKIGVASRNAFSHYWTANAWENELPEKVQVQYVAPERAENSGICHYLIKSPSEADVPKNVTENFRLTERSGDWLVYAKRN